MRVIGYQSEERKGRGCVSSRSDECFVERRCRLSNFEKGFKEFLQRLTFKSLVDLHKVHGRLLSSDLPLTEATQFIGVHQIYYASLSCLSKWSILLSNVATRSLNPCISRWSSACCNLNACIYLWSSYLACHIAALLASIYPAQALRARTGCHKAPKVTVACSCPSSRLLSLECYKKISSLTASDLTNNCAKSLSYPSKRGGGSASKLVALMKALRTTQAMMVCELVKISYGLVRSASELRLQERWYTLVLILAGMLSMVCDRFAFIFTVIWPMLVYPVLRMSSKVGYALAGSEVILHGS
ncbi:hypothetical protein Tco_1112183 [Tanacetum coccineum]|uniref:Uncharacterized protein n=1 Tax=Tanacetum coccineum TaxID=301880 RepID=A0ABQ5INS0_9ASTR